MNSPSVLAAPFLKAAADSDSFFSVRDASRSSKTNCAPVSRCELWEMADLTLISPPPARGRTWRPGMPEIRQGEAAVLEVFPSLADLVPKKMKRQKDLVRENPEAVPVIHYDGTVLCGRERIWRLLLEGREDENGTRSRQISAEIRHKAQKFGLSPLQADAMAHPVLVRTLQIAPEDRPQALRSLLIRAFERDLRLADGSLDTTRAAHFIARNFTLAELSEIEHILEEADAPLDEALDEQAAACAAVLRRAGFLDESFQGVLLSGNRLTPGGQRLLKQALLLCAVQSPARLRAMYAVSERLIDKIAAMLPEILRVELRFPRRSCITRFLPAAIDAVLDYRAHAAAFCPFDRYFAQMSLFRPPMAPQSWTLARCLNSLPPHAIRKAARRWARAAGAVPRQVSLFDDFTGFAAKSRAAPARPFDVWQEVIGFEKRNRRLQKHY